MELPELPKVLKKREANITPKIKAWFLENYKSKKSGLLVEIKVTKTNSIPKSAVKDHQLKALMQVKTKTGMVYKMPDIGNVRKPADFWMMKNADSFVVACFIKKRKRICLAILPEKWNGANPKTECSFILNL